jgi:hypothetical protein
VDVRLPHRSAERDQAQPWLSVALPRLQAGTAVNLVTGQLHHIHEDITCLEQQMAWFLITEIECYLAKVAVFQARYPVTPEN